MTTSDDYFVTNTNTCGNVISNHIIVTVNTAPNITTEPVSQAACAGSLVSFSVTSTGTGLTYQWRKGTTNLINGVNISGVTSDTLVINPVNISDTASNYNVVITGVCAPNDTSINVSLIINSPEITSEPANQTACAGSSVSFSVVSTGTGLTYQWKKGTLSLVNGGNISGATSATLTINPVSIADAASNYYVSITGVCAPDEYSVNVSLVINAIPNVVTEPISQTACTENSVSFSVAATGTNIAYQWKKGTLNLINGGNISGVTSSTLTINPVNSSDAAFNYYVIITGTCTSDDTSAYVTLSVNQTPVAVASANSPVCTGSSITLTAETVTGGTYLWTSVNGYSSTDQNPEILSSTTLNSGTYTLVISKDGCASIPSDVSVTVYKCIDFIFSIPEGFSPNSDGINDLFFIRGLDLYPNNSIVIFNRWGDKVFEANPYQNNWAGNSTKGLRLGGDELPVGTYFYILDLGDNSDVRKGTIYLNRQK